MKNLFFVSVFFTTVFAALLSGCATQTQIPEKTLAQVCAETYPCIDTIQQIFVEVEVPVPGLDTIIRDTLKCVDSVAYMVREIVTPGRTIYVKKEILTPSKIDSALRVAYKNLQTQYEKSIQDLQACNERIKNKAKPSTDWKIWLVVLGLLAVVVGQVWRRS